MYRHTKQIVPFCYKTLLSIPRRTFSIHPDIVVNEEVRFALEARKPLVALESTIVTHGMPFPENIKCALAVEKVVRDQGAVPATAAIINGKVKLGLSEDELKFLGDVRASKPIKTSRRDFPYVVGNKLNGGTTVSGTLIVANKAGIHIFATGGIGGVHRGADETFDISADLVELGRCGVAVVCSGVKSILDIPKTLEYLETQGVLVATFGDSPEFPAFYSRTSGSSATYCLKTASEAAAVIQSSKQLDLRSGMVFSVPIPSEHAIPFETMSAAIEEALRTAQGQVSGKEVTPVLLAQVARITEGRSLQANIALIKNNAKTAADIAVALAELESTAREGGETIATGTADFAKLEGRPVVIGGSNLDCSATLATSELKLDGRIHDGRISYTAGGVARNICEALCKLGRPANFVSAVGDDDQGALLTSTIPAESRRLVRTLRGRHTAQCVVVLDADGDCRFLVGDMGVHERITPEVIRCYENLIRTSPLVILDANLSVEALEEALRLAQKHSIPAFFEPTDVEISAKPFETPYWKAVKFITPNLNELRHIASFLKIQTDPVSCSKIEEAAILAKQLADYVENVIVTLGPDGVLLARKALATDPLLKCEKRDKLCVRHYPGEEVKNFVNVSGAGDCLASGIIAAMLSGLSEEECLSVGFAAARCSLFSKSAIPKEMFDARDCSTANNASALFRTIF